ncbi:MAG: L-serine ammonia-lyase [Pseudomonadota bacterium]
MSISIFELFSIGIGPSSSHTVGPMKAANAFIEILQQKQIVKAAERVVIDLYGSLALTGIGHGTDIAIVNGLEGQTPEDIIPEQAQPRAQVIKQTQQLNLAGKKNIAFDTHADLLLHQKQTLPLHTNGMCFSVFDAKQNILFKQIYYSIGGGFIVTDEEFGKVNINKKEPPYPFKTARELLSLCRKHQLSISELMLANETTWDKLENVRNKLMNIAAIMQQCIENGCHHTGHLPGRLRVKRRAAEIFQQLMQRGEPNANNQFEVMNWVNTYAMAVNEENAAGGRIVTAPTNGAAGIIPAVLQYYKTFVADADDNGAIDFLLTAGAIAILYKLNASISGAEVGCQGEVGVASSMAAGALTQVLGGSLEQIENAAEIAMEHHLGMTCDPIDGLVQIPCIERNAMGAIKAINAAQIALLGSGQNKISLDKIIATMLQTGKDMMTIYKETSLGGLAVNIPEC